MSKHRYIDTEFWDDEYIQSLNPSGKLLFVYCLTNPKTTICGIYKIAMRTIITQTGLGETQILEHLSRFESHGKIMYRNGWMTIRNFIRRQKVNKNVRTGIVKELRRVPLELAQWVLGDYLVFESGEIFVDFDRISKPFKPFESLRNHSESFGIIRNDYQTIRGGRGMIRDSSNKLYPYPYPYPYLYLYTTTGEVKTLSLLGEVTTNDPESGESLTLEVFRNGDHVYSRIVPCSETVEPEKLMSIDEFRAFYPNVSLEPKETAQ